MSPAMLGHDISCRFISIIIINQRRGGVAQMHTITALGNPPHHLEVHKRTNIVEYSLFGFHKAVWRHL